MSSRRDRPQNQRPCLDIRRVREYVQTQSQTRQARDGKPRGIYTNEAIPSPSKTPGYRYDSTNNPSMPAHLSVLPHVRRFRRNDTNAVCAQCIAPLPRPLVSTSIIFHPSLVSSHPTQSKSAQILFSPSNSQPHRRDGRLGPYKAVREASPNPHSCSMLGCCTALPCPESQARQAS